MSILLTGGAGYIGTHTAIELLNIGHEVIIIDNFVNSNINAISRIEQIAGKHVTIYSGDVCDIATLENVFLHHSVDGVIHFAGLKSVGESVKEPLKYYQNNIDSTISILKVMSKYKVKNLIFSSSATVYGNPTKLPITEDMTCGPCSNPYGWTKLMNEQIICDYVTVDPNFSAILLRYFNPVGAHNSGMIGEAPNGIPNNLMPYITQVAAGIRPHLNIFGNNYPTRDGTGIRDYIHVVDLAKGHVAAMEYCTHQQGVNTFNLGTGIGYSVLDIVNAFSKVNNVYIPLKITDRRSGDIASCYADATKAYKILGWRAMLSLEDMCRDSWNWQKNNPTGYE